MKEAIILAGGLRTRLRAAVPHLPKCMAPVNGRPFIAYLMDYYLKQGIEKFIFSLGYMHELVEDFIISTYPALHTQMVVEHEPLGTGGAIRLACSKVTAENVLVLNGDTFFGIDVATLASFHRDYRADCTLSLKPMRDFDRYGVVELNENGLVTRFREKQFYDEGLINGGVYALHVGSFMDLPLPKSFPSRRIISNSPAKKNCFAAACRTHISLTSAFLKTITGP